MTALHPGDRPAARPAPADAPHRPLWPALRHGLDTQRGMLVAVNRSTEAGG